MAQGQVVWIVVFVVVGCVAVAAVDEVRRARRVRTQLITASSRATVRAAFERLVSARARFSQDVMRFERALSVAEVAAGGGARAVPSPVIELERVKDRSRLELIQASEAWQRVHSDEAAHRAPATWFGIGQVSTWGLVLVGRERAFVRFEHATEEDLWVVLELRRWRIGLGLGAERLHLGAIGSRITPGTLLSTIAAAFDDVDLALRPGFAPLRALRAGLSPTRRRRAHRLLRSHSWVPDLRSGLAGEDRAMLRGLVDDENFDGPTLRLSAAGPTAMFGAWRGLDKPRVFLLSSSGQQLWEPESSIGSSEGTVTKSQS